MTRREKAAELVRRFDTVCIARVEEVQEIYRRADAGEFDDMDLENE